MYKKLSSRHVLFRGGITILKHIGHAQDWMNFSVHLRKGAYLDLFGYFFLFMRRVLLRSDTREMHWLSETVKLAVRSGRLVH